LTKVEISHEVDKALRDEIYKRSGGFKKGDIKAAVEEAILNWIQRGGKN